MAGVNTLSVVLCLACAPVPSLARLRWSRVPRRRLTDGGGEDERTNRGTNSISVAPSLSSYMERSRRKNGRRAHCPARPPRFDLGKKRDEVTGARASWPCLGPAPR
jgi:hypothetical protein